MGSVGRKHMPVEAERASVSMPSASVPIMSSAPRLLPHRDLPDYMRDRLQTLPVALCKSSSSEFGCVLHMNFPNTKASQQALGLLQEHFKSSRDLAGVQAIRE